MRKSKRKLFLFGRYSLALLLPKKWLKDTDNDAGDEMDLEFDQARGRIIIRLKPGSESSSGLIKPDTCPKAEKGDGPSTPSINSGQASSGSSRGKSRDGWEDIPQL